jgi:hypothetical protein
MYRIPSIRSLRGLSRATGRCKLHALRALDGDDNDNDNDNGIVLVDRCGRTPKCMHL